MCNQFTLQCTLFLILWFLSGQIAIESFYICNTSIAVLANRSKKYESCSTEIVSLFSSLQNLCSPAYLHQFLNEYTHRQPETKSFGQICNIDIHMYVVCIYVCVCAYSPLVLLVYFSCSYFWHIYFVFHISAFVFLRGTDLKCAKVFGCASNTVVLF